jgi:hypothetical protein
VDFSSAQIQSLTRSVIPFKVWASSRKCRFHSSLVSRVPVSFACRKRNRRYFAINVLVETSCAWASLVM